MTYRLHPGARTEHLDNVAYYESRQPGLGARYLAEFERVMAEVCRDPGRYRVEREPGVRRARMRRFPFAVLYREVDGTVEVLAVAHGRRRPGFWTGQA